MSAIDGITEHPVFAPDDKGPDAIFSAVIVNRDMAGRPT